MWVECLLWLLYAYDLRQVTLSRWGGRLCSVGLSVSLTLSSRKRMIRCPVVSMVSMVFVALPWCGRCSPVVVLSPFSSLSLSMPYILCSRVYFSPPPCSLFGLNSSTYVHERIDASIRGGGPRGSKAPARSASLAKLPPWQLARTCMVALLGFGLLTNIFAHYVFGITWHRCLIFWFSFYCTMFLLGLLGFRDRSALAGLV